ncbi:serine/arginine repetitive matrix protein 3 [Gopherus evgoodei]|uniref:serine/arginine repetitive matrix protein 3 n=1 Tax=Gopherus evgoodei TaxID=1825980 RepID=UPI0011CFA252|nr:serine/arginine repetitive matrix protein 3 [Gopherus evgoodei]
MALYNNGAKMPSPQEAANGFPQPGASSTWHKPEEEVRLVEPSLVKKAHREILDHERKRRVELKCMELQEMMEEQGYSEEEIRQKVGTFRQMLMEKEGVLTREDQHGRQIVIENHHMEQYAVEYPAYGEGCLLPCDCPADCYRDHCSHREHRLKRRMSSSASPPPKKKKKKKSGHRRSRKKRKPGSERSCDSSSPLRKEKKKKNGKKHRRDRSESGSRKKRRRRSRSPKNKRKEKTKERKRSPSNSPARRCHRHSSCSSHSASLSSDYSHSKSSGRLTPKHREDGHKPSSLRSSRSPSSSRTWHSRSATPHQNGHKGSAQNGRHSHGTPGEKQQDRLDSASPSPRGHVKTELPSPRSKGGRRGPRSLQSVSPEKGGRCSRGDKYRRCSRSASLHRHKGRSKGQASAQKESPHSLSHTDYSSDSEGSACSHPYPAARGAEKNHGAHLKKVKDRHHRGRPNSCSQSPVKHSRHNSERRKSLSRSSSWSSSSSPSKSRSRSREKRAARSRSQSPSQKKNSSRERDNEPRTRHSDTDPARARRRSRSYSPIRKRRRDSPSFMEPRRITSARKRPIPYYRPSPSSSSSLSSYSCSRSYSRSYDSYSTSRSRTRSPQSRSRTPSPSPSYNSHSSSESAGF